MTTQKEDVLLPFPRIDPSPRCRFSTERMENNFYGITIPFSREEEKRKVAESRDASTQTDQRAPGPGVQSRRRNISKPPQTMKFKQAHTRRRTTIYLHSGYSSVK